MSEEKKIDPSIGQSINQSVEQSRTLRAINQSWRLLINHARNRLIRYKSNQSMHDSMNLFA